jgi:hypothetical protein
MAGTIESLVTDDDGAVTVDWVVLTAAIVGLGFIAAESVLFGTENVAERTGKFVADVPVGGN